MDSKDLKIQELEKNIKSRDQTIELQKKIIGLQKDNIKTLEECYEISVGVPLVRKDILRVV